MSIERETGAYELASFTVGQRVHVHAMGSWYPGTVAKIGRARVTITYTSGAGVTRDKAINPAAVGVNSQPGTTRGRGYHVRSPEVLTEADYRALHRYDYRGETGA